MKSFRSFAVLTSLCLYASSVKAQNYAPPPVHPPSEAKLNAIAEQTSRLGDQIVALRRLGVTDPVLADVEVFYKAAVWIARHNEFYHANAGDWTLAALRNGFQRAKQASQRQAPWLQPTGQTIVRAHRSTIDRSVQPYAVTFPAEYGKDRNRKWRLDVVLHGREPSLTEVKFLQQHSHGRAAPKEQNFVQLDIYGRGNNAYRWAGEADVIEVVDDLIAVERLLGREGMLDPARVVLRGFSMGGAGTWHLGLHGPSRWCVLGPGAGFTTTHGYVKDLPAKLPPAQEACLHIYDALDYAENAFNVPIVAYAGERDPQLQAARNIEAQLKPSGIPLTFLVAPGLGHTFPVEWQTKAQEAYAPHVAKGRDEYPARVHFVTYTLRYPTCAWVEILGLDRHYQRSLVDAELTETSYAIKTSNVRAIHLHLQPNPPNPLIVVIDGQTLTPQPYLNRAGTNHLYLEHNHGQWQAVLPQRLITYRQRHVQKTPGLQGPIDDAFMEAFLCVRGTGAAWHEATQKFAEDNLKRFQEEWDKYLRGTLVVRDDTAITEEDLATRHLALFGDPASNSLIRQILDDLPLQWSREEIRFGGKSYAARDHVPVMVYPSPLNASRYIVLNSGHTFHAAEFQGTNALLFPRLGDYAVLRLAATQTNPLAADVATSGLFDDQWRLPKGE
jgi:dienelactone hydrolase